MAKATPGSRPYVLTTPLALVVLFLITLAQVVKVSGVSLLALFKGKKEKPRS